jgi:hypothetical protein
MTFTLTEEQVEAAIGALDDYAYECHSASLKLVKSGLLPQGARVARGTAPGVPGQHSWAVVGDPYKPRLIVDVTAWSYNNELDRVIVQNRPSKRYKPHGWGRIWDYGVPMVGDGKDIPLAVEVSQVAQNFLELVASKYGRTGLDRRGWYSLANAPVEGWPSTEIFEAMDDTPELTALIPIDILGMRTDRNPGGLYW